MSYGVPVYFRKLHTTLSAPKSAASTAISYVSARSEHELVGETIGELYTREVEKQPDKDMVVFSQSGIRLTYEQFKKKVRS